MSRVRIHISGDLDSMIRSLRDLREKGIPRAQLALDEVLAKTAALSFELAHTHEGSMRASQEVNSYHGFEEWEGEISYESRGVGFELQRGGEHSAFVDDLMTPAAEEDWEEAVSSVFDDLK